MSMKILIGGGTGFIGRHLQFALRRKGYEVICVSRSPGVGQITWNDVQDNGLPEDCSAVVNLSGRNVFESPLSRWTEETRDSMINSRVATTRLLVDAIKAAKHPPRVFVGSSGVGYYKPSLTTEYTEDSPGGDYDFMSSLVTRWEAASEQCPVRTVIIRTGVVLGRDGGVIQNMFWPFFFNLGGTLGSGQQWFPWIHIDDITGIFVHAIENGHVSGVLNGTAPNPVTNAQFTKAFARAMWRFAIFPVPSFVINRALGDERAGVVLEGQKVIPKKTLESGYSYIHPHIESACKDCATIVMSNPV